MPARLYQPVPPGAQQRCRHGGLLRARDLG